MHLYDQDGMPVYKVPYADKKRAGQLRDATLRDARKLGLYPSVTEGLGIVRDPGLDVWKINTHIMAALTQPQDGRPMDDLIPAVKANASEFSRAAMELGSRYHDAAEEMVHEVDTGSRVCLSMVRPFVCYETMYALRDWYVNNADECIDTERPFACDLGYGGRFDWLGVLRGNLTLIDWKTQGTKPGKPFRFYPKWGAQLAAYAYGIGYDLCEIDLVSVAISTTEPGRIQEKTWNNNSEYFSAFLDAFRLWKGPLGKNFDPAENARKLAA